MKNMDFFKTRKLTILSLISLAFTIFLFPQNAFACCGLCNGGDCAAAAAFIRTAHHIGEEAIQQNTTEQFNDFKTWFIEDFFEDQVLPAYMKMSTTLTAVAAHQSFVTGTLLDAQNQLETQRLYQELQTQAHKDYQPSESFCAFGTNVRSLANTEESARFITASLNTRQMARQLRKSNIPGAGGPDDDKQARWDIEMALLCDKNDNNGLGLSEICQNEDGENANLNVNYTRLIEEPRSLDFSLAGDGASNQAILLLADNLYGHKVPEFPDSSGAGNKNEDQLTMNLLSVAAKRNVAQSSFNAIIGLKAAGPDSADDAKTREFLGAIMKELGVPDDEIYEIIGEHPSYYAQLELLAKKLYQNPDFYAGLYDKPVNVARKSVAMKGIEMMLDRAIYESQLRQEMAMSVLLSSRLRQEHRNVNKELK